MTTKADEEFVKDGAEKITEKDIEKVVDKSEDIKQKFASRGPLKRFIEDAKLLLAFIKDYRSSKYRQVPYGIIAAAVFALLYVFNPFDLVPDVLPFVGAVDDATVIGACLLMMEKDLNKFRKWKEGQNQNQIEGNTE
ncbi:MAG TPA: YkvA family protein [Anaerolineales bacterium]|nr:YkvA family protein [Anaerolineales bacterium]